MCNCSADLWQLEGREECGYFPHCTFPVKALDSTWLSDKSELALTFMKYRIVRQDVICGGTVKLYHLGIT